MPTIGDRSLFPDLTATAYLNHSAISPLCQPVRQAAAQTLDLFAQQGMAAFSSVMEQRAQLRADLAALIGAQPEDLALTPNTTDGVRHVAMSLPWQPGDRVVLFSGEFPANITPWQQAAQTFDLRLSWLPLTGFGDSSGDGLARLEAVLRQGVRLVAVSAVQFQTGLAMPIDAISALCRQHGAELFVDAIQGCGAVPMSVAGVDYLAAGGHKWLMGVMGCGFLYVSPERISAMVPRMAGWLSHEDGLLFLSGGPDLLRYDRPIRQQADFLEGGAFGVVASAALGAAVPLIRQLTVPAIFAHIQRYHDALEPGLLARGFTSRRAADPSARSGILSAQPPAGVAGPALVEGLVARGIAVTLPDGHVRFAPHWSNSLDEVPVVLSALDEVLRAETSAGQPGA